MGAIYILQTYRNSCKFFSESDQKKKMAMVISEIQVSDPGPFWPSCILSRTISLWITFNLLSANAFNLDWSKILLFGKGLTWIPAWL